MPFESIRDIVVQVLPAADALIAVIISVLCMIRYRQLFRAYDAFMRGRDTKSLEELIMQEQEEIRELQASDEDTREALRTMNRKLRSCYQKTGVVHYDAFLGMGGKMSFAMALLDFTDSGFILNCMHSRDGCFLYVKEVDAGTTSTPLGTEEKEALERALGYIKD